ncbi:MAG: Rid family detoxifying hydrolase [Anaerolineae bacterium]
MRSVSTERAPAALGHYSQAIVSGGYVFASGQLPINPASGQVETDSIEDQMAQAMANVSAVLDAAGSSLDRVVKVTLYLSDMSLFARANAAYAKAFGEHRPARSAVPTLPLPRGALVEVDVVAEVAPHG